MTDVNSFIHSIELRRKMLQECGKLNKEALFKALCDARIDRITIGFDGEGDSGQLERPVVYGNGGPASLAPGKLILHHVEWHSDRMGTQELSIAEAIEALCYDLLEQDNHGWENNDGAYGEFVFYVAEGRIELELNARYTDVHTTPYVF